MRKRGIKSAFVTRWHSMSTSHNTFIFYCHR